MSNVNFDIPDSLLNHAKDKGIVVIAGAGVSAGSPSLLPNWSELNFMIVAALCHRIDTYLNRPAYTQQVRKAIDVRRSANLFPSDYQAQIIEESCGDYYFKALQSLDINVKNPAHDGIAWLAKHGLVSAVITTNFDRLVELSLEAQKILYEVAYDSKTYEKCLHTLQSELRNAPLQILKVHGCVRDHHSMIDTLKQRLLGRNLNLLRCLSQLLEDHLLLIVGFSAADLEIDKNYLQLLPSAVQSPGLIYVQWPGSKDLSAGARILLDTYTGKVSKVVIELDIFFRSICHSLGIPDPPKIHYDSNINTKKLVETKLTRWATDLHPAAAINCLAGIAEANGEVEATFELLHRFWKDIIPKDRSGKDFEFYRYQHGRLGMGGGILSMVDDLDKSVGEESFQNLLRCGYNRMDARALAWAGMAWLWAGVKGKALSNLSNAIEYLKQAGISPEEQIDTSLTLAEAFYVLGEPEIFLNIWKNAANVAETAGDLPRQAKIIAITSLYYAEFMPDAYMPFVQGTTGAVLERAKRLNDPIIAGFTYLARGRYFIKTRASVTAIEALKQASEYLKEAGRPPWLIFVSIEYSKALLDQKKVTDAADVLNAVNKSIDRYQMLLPWLEEAKGQLYACNSQNDEARNSFQQAVDYAMQMGLNRRAEVLRKYLALLPKYT